jgi:nicotinamidase-related amidase
VTVIEDACRSIDVDGSASATQQSFAAFGIARVESDVLG